MNILKGHSKGKTWQENLKRSLAETIKKMTSFPPPELQSHAKTENREQCWAGFSWPRDTFEPFSPDKSGCTKKTCTQNWLKPTNCHHIIHPTWSENQLSLADRLYDPWSTSVLDWQGSVFICSKRHLSNYLYTYWQHSYFHLNHFINLNWSCSVF